MPFRNPKLATRSESLRVAGANSLLAGELSELASGASLAERGGTRHSRTRIVVVAESTEEHRLRVPRPEHLRKEREAFTGQVGVEPSECGHSSQQFRGRRPERNILLKLSRL